MKTKNHENGIFNLAISGIIILAAICFNTIEVKAQSTIYSISGNASGAQVVPAVTGSGTGTITGSYDPATKVLDYTATWNNLTGGPTTAGFYTGAAGVNGKILGDTWMLGTNNKPNGNISGKMKLTAAQENDLLAGNWYYSYGTDTNVNGEIRGQIAAREQ